MPNQVLIVAPAGDAAPAAEVARSLDFAPLVAHSEQDALELLAKHRFEVLAVSETQPPSLSRRAAELQPWAELITLPSSNGKIGPLREALVHRKAAGEEPISPERFQSLSKILESFTATLDLEEVLRRIVTVTREEFKADRAFLIHPVNADSGTATVTIEDSDPRYRGPFAQGRTITLDAMRVHPTAEPGVPVVAIEGDLSLGHPFTTDFSVRSQMVELLKPRDEQPWIFGLHQCSTPRRWSSEERRLFAEVGRYATIALSNTLLHERAVREMAKVTAILDQIPESAAIYDATGHLERMNAAAIREGNRAAEELARREVDARVRLEGVLESAPIGIAVVSADELRFEVANLRWHEFAAMYGKIAGDTKVIGLRAAEVIPGFEQTLKQVADTGEPRVDEALQISGTPGPTWFNRIISPVRGRLPGITQSITVLVQDVTDQVRAKREIEGLAQMMEERSARLDSILGSMVDGLWVYDAQGNVVDVNQAALTMFGLGSRTEAVQHGSFDKLSLRYPDGRSIPRADFPYARALRGQVVPDYLAIGRHLITGKDLDLSIAAAPIESNGVVGAVLVVRDITALQELDRKKDEFLSVASHELRTPLTTIKGYTQLLAQTVHDTQPHERITYLNAVLGEIERMMGLISELLDVSRIETNRLQIHPQSVDWIEFMERRASAFRVQNRARLIHFDSDAAQVLLNIDPDRMRQVVDNLLSNALKYSGEKTDVELKVRVNGQWVETAIIDYGIGIPRDEIPQLFERFHRARNVSSRYYGGLGLGLYIAKAIVEVHGGRITIESEEGKGATFTISLPLNGPTGTPAA